MPLRKVNGSEDSLVRINEFSSSALDLVSQLRDEEQEDFPLDKRLEQLELLLSEIWALSDVGY